MVPATGVTGPHASGGAGALASSPLEVPLEPELLLLPELLEPIGLGVVPPEEDEPSDGDDGDEEGLPPFEGSEDPPLDGVVAPDELPLPPLDEPEPPLHAASTRAIGKDVISAHANRLFMGSPVVEDGRPWCSERARSARVRGARICADSA